MEFIEFPKMARLTREVIVTEKIDGTNAQIAIDESGEMFVGSRTRWLSAGADNFGFYDWCMAHKSELLALGPGRHFGEWWGKGIQRGYGLTEKRLSLFNVSRWGEDRDREKYPDGPPACVGVVPVLFRGLMSPKVEDGPLARLRHEGSVAAPGFMKPEGIVVFHVASGVSFKKTLEKDDQPKGRQREG